MSSRSKRCAESRLISYREMQASWKNGLKKESMIGRKIWIKSENVRQSN
jgi:hypothetical protein